MRFANPLKKDRTVASTRGHILTFPGKTTDGLVFMHVPPAVQAEVIAAGMMPESEIEEKEEAQLPVAPTEPAEREAALHVAFDALVARGDREDFAGNGSPKPDAVAKITGWKADSKELKASWVAYQSKPKD